MVEVRHTGNAVLAWEKERERGIAYPATIVTDIEKFTFDVRMVSLESMRGIRFTSLVYDPSYTRNYIPMRAFLNEKHPSCVNISDGNEREYYKFLEYGYEVAKELYVFFFEHATKVEYPDGYVEYNFVK